MAHQVETMAYAASNGPPWHQKETGDASVGVGEDGLSLTAIMEAARLDWQVHTEPVLYYPDGPLSQPLEVPDAQIVVREFPDGRKEPLATVGGRFTPIQNRQVGALALDLTSDSNLQFETAGSLFGGRNIWFLARISEPEIAIDDRPIDRYQRYLLLLNGHDGSQSLTLKMTTVRVVCNNTKTAALRGDGIQVSVRHLSGAADMGAVTQKAASAILAADAAFAQHVLFARKARAAAWAAGQMDMMTIALFAPGFFDEAFAKDIDTALHDLSGGKRKAEGRDGILRTRARAQVATALGKGGCDLQMFASDIGTRTLNNINFVLQAAQEESSAQARYPDGNRKPGAPTQATAWDWHNAVTGAATHLHAKGKSPEARMGKMLGYGATLTSTAERMIAAALG